MKSTRKNRLKYLFSELKLMLILSIPGALMELANRMQTYIIFISLGHLTYTSANLINGVVLGLAIWYAVGYTTVSSIATTMETYCSQSNGAKNPEQVGIYFLRANIIGFLSWFPIWGIFILSGKLISCYSTYDQVTIHSLLSLITTLCYGYPCYCFTMLTFRLLQAQCLIMANLTILMLGVASNVIMQYLFLYVFTWGVHGAALAISLSFYLTTLLYMSYLIGTSMQRKLFKKLTLDPLNDWCLFLKNVSWNFGLKVCIILPCRVSLLIIALIVKDASQLAIYGYYDFLWSIYSSFCLGLGYGASTRVGNLLGANEPTKSKQSAVTIVVFGSLLTLILSLIPATFSYQIACVFTSNEIIQRVLTITISYCSLLYAFDSTFIIQGVFYGCGLNKLSLKVYMAVTLCFTLPVTSVLVYYWELRVIGFSIGFQIGLSICGLILLLILFCYDWEKLAKIAVENTNLNVKNNFKTKTDSLLSLSEFPTLLVQANRFGWYKSTFLLIRFLILLLIGIVSFVLVQFCFVLICK